MHKLPLDLLGKLNGCQGLVCSLGSGTAGQRDTKIAVIANRLLGKSNEMLGCGAG
jgi:hypothetical protein